MSEGAPAPVDELPDDPDPNGDSPLDVPPPKGDVAPPELPDEPEPAEPDPPELEGIEALDVLCTGHTACPRAAPPSTATTSTAAATAAAPERFFDGVGWLGG
jgi:hypothetical protein